MKNEIEKRITEYINSIFTEYQNKFGIEYGDVDILDTLEMSSYIHILSLLMVDVLKKQL